MGYIVAGTGHRPNKLGGYTDEITNALIKVASKHLDGVDKVISGMALGWDWALAIAAYNKGIPFIAAVPFDGQDSAWPEDSRIIYRNLLDLSERVVIVNDGGYAAWKMQTRNVWAVDNSDYVLALWDGTSGGTRNCIAYAHKQGKLVHNLWADFEHERKLK